MENPVSTHTRTRPSRFHYRLHWQPQRLGWSLTYDGQEWAFISAYLPGRPQMDERRARQWADDTLGCSQPWERDGAGSRAVPVTPTAPEPLNGASDESR